MDTVDILALPPGFGFHPTDEELVLHYLKWKVLGKEQESLKVIPEIELYKCEPWDLPGKSYIPSRDCKWHFFCSCDRKYPHGSRKNRTTEAGYWKATGKDRNIHSAKRIVGSKKTLVFHEGRAPHGKRTDWVMHEYHLDAKEYLAVTPGLHDSYVLCRVSKKNGLESQIEDVIAVKTEISDYPLEETAHIPQYTSSHEEAYIRETGGVALEASSSEDSLDKWLNSIIEDPDPWMASYVETSENELKVDPDSPKTGDLAVIATSNTEFHVNQGRETAQCNLEGYDEFNSTTYSGGDLADEQKILEEMYEAATGDGISLSDLGFEDETANDTFIGNDTGIQIRRRNQMMPQESKGEKIRLQIYKMESAATTAVQTCTYEDQSVGVLSEHEDSDYELGEQLHLLKDFSTVSPDETVLCFTSGGSVSSSSPHETTCEPKTTTITRLSSPTHPSMTRDCSDLTVTTSGTKSVSRCSKPAMQLSTYDPPQGSLPFLSRKKGYCTNVASERTEGESCGFTVHLRRHVSVGLNWLCKVSCVLGTSLPLVYFLLGNICCYVGGSSIVDL